MRAASVVLLAALQSFGMVVGGRAQSDICDQVTRLLSPVVVAHRDQLKFLRTFESGNLAMKADGDLRKTLSALGSPQGRLVIATREFLTALEDASYAAQKCAR